MVDEAKVWEYFMDIIAPVVKEKQVQRSQCSKSLGELLLEFSQAVENIFEIDNLL